MQTTNWILYLALAALLGGLAVTLYAWREPGGRARFAAAALRAAALALALLLVFDPWLPAGARGAGGGPLVLLDDSWSMRLPAAPDGATRWQRALEAVRGLDADRVTLLSGNAVDVEGLAALTPAGPNSRLAPAVRAAVEAGARSVVLVSDGGLTDLTEAARLLAEAGTEVRVLDVASGPARNAAVAAVVAPGSGRAGERVVVRVDVAALGMGGDSLRVTLERDGAVQAVGAVVAPGDGRLASLELSLALPADRDRVRLRLLARVSAADDAAAADDARPFFIDVEERPRGIVLLSLAPDWEPRFLVPVLERSSGVPVRGYIRTPAGGYLTIGTGTSAARRVSEAVVRADIERAAVAVLHGVGGGGPAWVRQALSHDRLLVFPAPDLAAGMLPAPLDALLAGAGAVGEWYVAAQPTASPVAPLMASLSLSELPPLTSLRPLRVTEGAWAPLRAQLDRRGESLPVAVAGGVGERRWVVAAGSGYWRWALRGGAARRAYGLFWSSLVGWLTEDLGAATGETIRPEERVVELGEPVRWRVGGDADSVRIILRDSALDTTVAVVDGVAVTGALQPGAYAWEAVAGAASADGELAVAGWTPEMVRPSRDLSVLSGGSATMADGQAGARRRLHARAWPWLLLVGLLCGEWILRRRIGLR